MTDTPPRLADVQYGRAGNDHPFQRVVATRLSFDEVVAAIRLAINDADLWIIHEIDPQMLLARGGYAIGRTRQILFFHPRYMVRLLAAEPAALPEAPLKAVIVEDEDAVRVRWLEPEALFGRYGDDELSQLGREFEAVYAGITARLSQ